MEKHVQDAEVQLEAEKALPTATDKTDKVNREVKRSTMSKLKMLAEMWLGKIKTLPLPSVADPIKKTDASEPALPEPVDQPVSPEGALSLAGSSHGIAFKSHFRLHDRMLVMLDLILDASNEAELEKQRLIWRRMVSAMSQLLSFVKASIVSMEKYIKTKEQSKEKAALLQKGLVDKEAMAKQKADLGARSKKLAQRTGSQPAVPLFPSRRGCL